MLHITPSERQALRLLAQDHPIGEVARALGVSASVVDIRLGILFARMGVSGRAEAVESASRRGLLVLEHDCSADGSAAPAGRSAKAFGGTLAPQPSTGTALVPAARR